ncbi:hypothetical protein C5C66_09825 [Rathayibacter toxicus]|uniref:Glycosyltransferase 2-like domain-containing protein n=1 Tax=Rathayibacter toxicus TaxID=145458 RepID=A0A0C5BU29_9MICO|nr:glycosyltransferase [Rathayibacter toxicus]AJM78167.1 hypothetical protein TI83_09960 [Rathayibacter toxicus]ALS57567.1 hypothetical protein APU90_07105 [Rathayibacter toxicus]KKM44923.1 hypothetical protein VT73_07270 [Rathayibacter toxicus]PPG20765.1 hypothetical protein C5D15_09820 [Rathayibacter toxicus]PPG45868.1 hypothetical protein C5D16_09785 [Rathayibacter toxicus]
MRRPGSDRLVSTALITLWLVLVFLASRVLPVVPVELGWVGTVLDWILAVVIGTIWMAGIRSLFVISLYPLLIRRIPEVPARYSEASVALLYCTADDFNAAALTASMEQSYDRVGTFILDDSKNPHIRADIDDFASRTGASVVRRSERTGFKAGNLNNFLLAERNEYDYVVIVDSDQVLPPSFVRRALDHAAYRSESGARVGVVQGRHNTLRRVSAFADEFGALLETHVRVTQLVRSVFGFSQFLGRGALISTECLRATGGFPEVVTEDLAFSIEATQKGFEIFYAPDLVSTEEFPVDYAAFKKQYSKFSQGNTEIVRHYLVSALWSPLRPWQKVDLLLETVSAPLGAVLSALMLVFSAFLLSSSSAGGPLPFWVGLTLGLGGLLPLFPETMRRLRQREFRSAALFFMRAVALYSSVLWTTVATFFTVALGGRARFMVTPKIRNSSRSVSCRADVIAALALAWMSGVTCGSIVPAVGFIAAAACAVYFSVMSSGWKVTAPELGSYAPIDAYAPR